MKINQNKNAPIFGVKMKRFIYILTCNKTEFLHVGMCNDIVKTLAFYQKLPRISDNNLTRLIYLEEYTTETSALQRFDQLHKMNRAEKDAVILVANPDLIELIPNVNI